LTVNKSKDYLLTYLLTYLFTEYNCWKIVECELSLSEKWHRLYFSYTAIRFSCTWYAYCSGLYHRFASFSRTGTDEDLFIQAFSQERSDTPPSN